jgi:hypothetical protein
MKTEERGKLLVLLEDQQYHDMVIPAGTTWDGASIPKIFRHWLGKPREPKFHLASLVHDWIYETKYKSKFEADTIFAYELLKHGVDARKVHVMAVGLMFCGWIRYYRPKKAPLNTLKSIAHKLALEKEKLSV